MVNTDTSSYFSAGEGLTISYIRGAFALLSLVSTSMVFTIYVFLPKVSFSARLALYVTVSDMAASAAYLIGAPQDGTRICTAQAFLLSFFTLASIFWTVAIAYAMNPMDYVDNGVVKKRNIKKYHFMVWGGALLFASIPLYTSNYGDTGPWCWITVANNNVEYDYAKRAWGIAWRIIPFYLPLWSSVGYNIYKYFKVRKQITQMAKSGVISRLLNFMVFRMKYYPIILIVCYSWDTINRIYEMFFPTVFWMATAMTVTVTNHGFINAVWLFDFHGFREGCCNRAKEAGSSI